ncbi:copper chaperone PCu(A)C [Hydrogenovibrio kuenenii]|uniref:copper chaperone PCu(A)C n=1 Tax=Hydrogenovibrio kuenenii TaxID=63658 RepID=UPI000464AE27|nr:copper chaperone PCu(A)C [Hydrogenovibrio kuenenii]
MQKSSQASFFQNKSYAAAIILLSSLFISTMASAMSKEEASQIQVSNPYAREVPPGAMASASFMTLKNTSAHDIYLIQAESKVAKKVELHTHIHDNGVMRMRQVQDIKIPAHGMTMLQPGGFHIMLIGLQQKLVKGEQIQVQLTFKDGSHKTVKMPVKAIKGMGGMMKMHNM